MQNISSPNIHVEIYYLTITDLKGQHLFSSADIIRMEAANNYTVFYFTRHRPFVTSKVLKVYEEMLVPYGFIRTHRSHLVNQKFVKRIENNCLVMQDSSVAELAKRRKSSIVRQLKKSSNCHRNILTDGSSSIAATAYGNK